MYRLAIMLLVLSGWVCAHSLDQLVQAAYLDLGLKSLELELVMTPGQEIAPELLLLIDQNQDRQLNPSEMRAYANQILNEVSLRVDGTPQTLDVQNVTTPQTADFLAGTGIFQIVAYASLPERSGRHVLEFANAYQPVPSAYLVNSFVQSEQLRIASQARSPDQREYRLEYGLESGLGVELYLKLAGVLLVLVVGLGLGRRFLSKRGWVSTLSLKIIVEGQ